MPMELNYLYYLCPECGQGVEKEWWEYVGFSSGHELHHGPCNDCLNGTWERYKEEHKEEIEERRLREDEQRRKEKARRERLEMEPARSLRFWKAQKRKYGLSKIAWVLLYHRQGGRCVICWRLFEDVSSWSVRLYGAVTDHDHATGKVRGLLCSFCNGELGGYEKGRRARLSQSEAAYLDEPPASGLKLDKIKAYRTGKKGVAS